MIQDLQRHFIIVNKFKNTLLLDESDFSDEQNRQLALSTALKCAGKELYNFYMFFSFLKLKINFYKK